MIEPIANFRRWRGLPSVRRIPQHPTEGDDAGGGAEFQRSLPSLGRGRCRHATTLPGDRIRRAWLHPEVPELPDDLPDLAGRFEAFSLGIGAKHRLRRLDQVGGRHRKR